MIVRVRTNAGTLRVSDLDPSRAAPADVMAGLASILPDDVVIVGLLCSDPRCEAPLDATRSLADQGIRHGGLVHCRAVVPAADATAPATPPRGGRRESVGSVGGEAVVPPPDNDDEDEDAVVVGGTAAASSSTAARKRGSTVVVGGGKEALTASSRRRSFAPFTLYETTTARSAFRTNEVARGCFRTLRQTIGMDDDEGRRMLGRRYQWMFVFNFLVDVSYLLETLGPEIFQFHRVVVFYGCCGESDDAMEGWRRRLHGTGNTVEFVRVVPTDPPRSRTNPLPSKMRYGVHHTKMFLVGYEDAADVGKSMCRVIVQTANLTRDDIEYKTQGAYCQDFPLKKSSDENGNDGGVGSGGADGSKGNGKMMPAVDNPYKRKLVEIIGKGGATAKCEGGLPFEEEDTPFEDDLVIYLESYHYTTRQTWTASTPATGLAKPMSWLQLIRQYDYSEAYVVLIPSGEISSTRFGSFSIPKGYAHWILLFLKQCPDITRAMRTTTSDT